MEERISSSVLDMHDEKLNSLIQIEQAAKHQKVKISKPKLNSSV